MELRSVLSLRPFTLVLAGFFFLSNPSNAQDKPETLDPILSKETWTRADPVPMLRGWVLVQMPPARMNAIPRVAQASHQVFRDLAESYVRAESENLREFASPDEIRGVYLVYSLLRAPDGDVFSRVDLRPQAPLVPLETPAPEYPRDAFLTDKEGEIHIELTVDPSGEVLDADILHASPRNLFESAALSAVKRWKFEPFQATGQGLSYRDIYVINFRLD